MQQGAEALDGHWQPCVGCHSCTASIHQLHRVLAEASVGVQASLQRLTAVNAWQTSAASGATAPVLTHVHA